MTLVVERSLQPDQRPVHVLIIVVGKYLSFTDLPLAGDFTEEIAAFWRKPRLFPDQQTLSSIAVLASDAVGPVSIQDDANQWHQVDRPDFESCKAALIEWATRVKTDQGVGVLHWVGHGQERAQEGGPVSLFVDGARDDDCRSQQGLSWTKTLHYINKLTTGLPVYCFIDACRIDDASNVEFDGIGPSDSRFYDDALVFYSCRPGMSAFWLNEPKPAVVNSGCPGQAVGTRAFMQALDHYGAQFAGVNAPRHPVKADEIKQGASKLVDRWLIHQGIAGGGTTGPRGDCADAMFFTQDPKSVVEVRNLVPPRASSCHALGKTSSARHASETISAPFQFRLCREDHRFDFGAGKTSNPQSIIHPWVLL